MSRMEEEMATSVGELDADFIAHLAKMQSEKKYADKTFKKYPFVTAVVWIDTDKQSFDGVHFFYGAAEARAYSAKTEDVNAEIDKAYSADAPRRTYRRGN